MLRFRPFCLFIILCCGFSSTSCAAQSSANPSSSDAGLPACPDSPNCVSSDAQDAKHQIAPLKFTIPVPEAWQIVQEQVARLPRTTVVTSKPGYLQAECRSAVFGFVDDLELQLRAEQGVIAVRSAARTGYYDFGANRKRVEALRAALIEAGISP